MAQASADDWRNELERVKRAACSLNDPLSREMLRRYYRDLEATAHKRAPEQAVGINI